jgi:hypothetical protein
VSALVLVWFFSLLGAGLFFAAGHYYARLRGANEQLDALSSVAGELEETRAHMRGQEQRTRELRGRGNQLATELTRSQTELQQLRKLSDSAPGLAASVPPPPAAGPSTPSTPSTPSAASAPSTNARPERADQTPAVRAASAVAEDRLGAANETRAHSDRLAAVEQELALTRESLRSREHELNGLRESAAHLRRVEEQLVISQKEVVALTEQTRNLRADAYISSRPPRAAAERIPTTSSRGQVLQSIVDRETATGRVRSAVIADELGLVVAASGNVQEYGDALAALGAYLADVGSKTRDVLPLREVRQVIVRDDCDMTLMVRRLATEDSVLALVTLTVAADSSGSIETRAS